MVCHFLAVIDACAVGSGQTGWAFAAVSARRSAELTG
jgi:hypothetical protein